MHAGRPGMAQLSSLTHSTHWPSGPQAGRRGSLQAASLSHSTQEPLAASQIRFLPPQSAGPAQGSSQRRRSASQVPAPQSASTRHSTQRLSRGSQTRPAHVLESTHSTHARVTGSQLGLSGGQCASSVHCTQSPPRSQAGFRGSAQSASAMHCTHRPTSESQTLCAWPAHSRGSAQR